MHPGTHKKESTSWLLGCIPQACKPCSCPASRLKREPGHSDRDIIGLLDKETLHIWSKVLEQHPTVCGRRQTGRGSSPPSSGNKRLPFIGGVDVRLAYQSPGKPAAWAGGKHVPYGDVSNAGRRKAEGVQRAREQPSWMAWPYEDQVGFILGTQD